MCNFHAPWSSLTDGRLGYYGTKMWLQRIGNLKKENSEVHLAVTGHVIKVQSGSLSMSQTCSNSVVYPPLANPTCMTYQFGTSTDYRKFVSRHNWGGEILEHRIRIREHERRNFTKTTPWSASNHPTMAEHQRCAQTFHSIHIAFVRRGHYFFSILAPSVIPIIGWFGRLGFLVHDSCFI